MDYDAAWKRFFRLPIMVEHLLQGFAPEIADLLDCATLRELSASWAGADAEQRHGDSVWRAQYRDRSGRSLVLLLEFQSTVDRDMAARVLRYQSMVFESLRRQRDLDADRQLRVFSVVIHSGTARWTAPGGAARVTVDADGEILHAQPYLLLDTRRGAPDDLPADNIVAAVFQLDNAPSADAAAECFRGLAENLSTAMGTTEQDTVLAALLDWLGVALPKMFPASGPAAVGTLRDELRNREESMTRLARRAKEWESEWLREGMERGIEQGMERGIERGMEDQRALLCRQAERKFGREVAGTLARRLVVVTDSERLALVADWIIDCDTGPALLQRVAEPST